MEFPFTATSRSHRQIASLFHAAQLIFFDSSKGYDKTPKQKGETNFVFSKIITTSFESLPKFPLITASKITMKTCQKISNHS